MEIMKITKEDLQVYKDILAKEQDMLNRILETNENISKIYYNENLIVMQFKTGTTLTNEYLEKLKDIIEYKSYNIETVTVTEKFLNIKYKENTLQLNIIL